MVVRKRGLPAFDTPCSRFTDPPFQGVGARPSYYLADRPARISNAEGRPAKPASIRGTRRVGFNPVSQNLRAVQAVDAAIAKEFASFGCTGGFRGIRRRMMRAVPVRHAGRLSGRSSCGLMIYTGCR
jgi:hypothetical protein